MSLTPKPLITGQSLQHDIPVPEFFPPEFKAGSRKSQLWMGKNSWEEPRISDLHADPGNNMFTLISGRKRITLFDPSSVERLDTPHRPTFITDDGRYEFEVPAKKALDMKNYLNTYSSSIPSDLIDPLLPSRAFLKKEDHVPAKGSDVELESRKRKATAERAEFAKSHYPLFKKATRTVVELEPMDTLFIPKGWFHHVRSFEQHTAINSWYG